MMPVTRNISRTILVSLLLAVIVFGSIAAYCYIALGVESAKVAGLEDTISQLQAQDARGGRVAIIPAQ